VGTNYAYHGIDGLYELLHLKTKQIQYFRLRHLNHAHKLARKMGALSEHKRFLAAAASGKLEHVDRIVRLGLTQGRSVNHMISQYVKAAKGLYKPKDYQEEDYPHGLILWKHGGNRLASFGHQTLVLPSINTLKNQVRIPPVRLSARCPTVEDVSANVSAAFGGLENILKPSADSPVNHAVLIFDEIAIEPRLCWDPTTNWMTSLCREHAHTVLSKFESEDDMNEVFRGVDEGTAHLGHEVCASESWAEAK
jgi:hypothetical protein